MGVADASITKAMGDIKTVLVTGGAGYVGAVLVPELLKCGYQVRVLDLFIYGEHVLAPVGANRNLKQIKADIRNHSLLREALVGCDAVIHLACISNDPSVELDPKLSDSINYQAFRPLLSLSVEAGVRRFIFASSGSVYGVSDKLHVTEEHPLVPLSSYNKLKAECEQVLFEYQSPDFTTVAIRPATISGYSPRQRLDLTVNVLTSHAYNKGLITVFGGTQMRPNVHMKDMVELYVKLLSAADKSIAGEVFNFSNENLTVNQIAEKVRAVVLAETEAGFEINIETAQSDDPRSYHLSSKKIEQVLGISPKRTVEDGALELVRAFKEGRIPNYSDSRYYNVKRMKEIGLT